MNTRLLLTLACAAVLTACSSADSAGQPTVDVLSWVHPVEYTDNTPMPLSAIESTVVAWGTTVGGPYPNTVEIAAPATTATFNRPGDGTGTRCYKPSTKLKVGASGMYAAEVCKVVKFPKEPTGVTVQ